MKHSKYIYGFSAQNVDGSAALINLLGGKGANLAEMSSLNIPVPPGFTISTEVCNYFLKNNSFPPGFKESLFDSIAKIERILERRFGSTQTPLLFSVRSGARQSMPGMMETVLNVGLTSKTLFGLISQTKDERFVYDSYRRLIMMYSDVVMEKANNVNVGIREHLDSILIKRKKENNIINDADLSVDTLKGLCKIFTAEINNKLQSSFPDDPYEQLWGAIKAVFISWNGFRAKEYRKIENIPNDWGTAVTIQSMVFGNMGRDSATGVAFTRNPSSGHNHLYGEWLPNAQGEDVVAGIRTPYPINEDSKNALTIKKDTLELQFPNIYNNLLLIKDTLEKHYCDMQDIEFTIQEGVLWMLQTRSGKRNGHAAIKIGLDLYKEGLIDEEKLANRIAPSQIEEIMHPYFNPEKEKQANLLTVGLPAGPGCAIGRAVFNPERAQELSSEKEGVVLIREETSPEDIHGMHVSNAIITARGGMTSHAALVARGWGKCCVVGCNEIVIDYQAKQATINNVIINEGDWVAVNGSTGSIYNQKIDLIDMNLDKNQDFNDLFNVLINNQKIGVRANADTGSDAKKARAMGAKGIGLCRTEHMFFEPDRINEVRKMIVFRDNLKIRKNAIMNLLPLQKKDFYSILKAMSPHPVTIRLLDPPLHEFLPHDKKQVSQLAALTGVSNKKIEKNISQLYENNPMLGHRGCRLGISYPEITEMQATAILEAATQLAKEGVDSSPEIMVPLVGSVNEFNHQKEIIVECADRVELENRIKINYNVGTMIELPRACLVADKIAQSADFFSFGTNDLTQTTFGFSRDDVSTLLNSYIENGIISNDPFQSLDIMGVGKLIEIAVKKAREVNPNIKIGICGEHGGDPQSILFFKNNGFDYVSCSPFRVPIAILCASKNK
ncbi:MAG: pyruvate, phosphate dikinase [Candidatus Marinimicrobia bacterium]|nr:pyruvate, phosphate dikinase [Candidatus Neomarinimicrobiota bacterium]